MQHNLNANSYLDESNLREMNLWIRCRFHDIIRLKANSGLSKSSSRHCYGENNVELFPDLVWLFCTFTVVTITDSLAISPMFCSGGEFLSVAQ